MADSRAGKLIAAVVDEQTSRNRLKHLIKDYGKREALTLVEPITDLNLLQISVVVGNLSAGRRRSYQPHTLFLLPGTKEAKSDLLPHVWCS